ncbi:hypothetical protein [Cohnella sp. AR92]|uniref:hypothetical protein n=1 Tax=Cohnella sp. AR92 TaxID=648716 RepID=UPI000F8D4059|nr:hypothetical protein [Cohnella sp. AR92]RUS48512.1 hypothetical protein ELR57_03605 [Cohnella sp. AR92]
MDMLSLQASFSTQEQAEEAVRKLASLRANRFRMERATGGIDFGSKLSGADSSLSELSASLLGDSRMEAANELGTTTGEENPAFNLTVDVPSEAMEKARKVISQAGGQCH